MIYEQKWSWSIGYVPANYSREYTIMRMRDLKDALSGAQRRCERLEEALRQCLLATQCAGSDCPDDPADWAQAVYYVEGICERALKEVDDG